MESSQQQQQHENGFNNELGKTWIYPTNLPIRTYQKAIVSEALFKNTMVCLPTGLGKTFIAAVVMYNYYRWFPQGRIIFMATSKPLVKQQVEACYKIVAIPKESTAELTGAVLKQNRQQIWKSKRVFFLTPQVLLHDLDTVSDLGKEIKCIVLDEAHRARGNHAYCEVIRKLISINSDFRVLALTATPASSVNEVINVCKNLLISHLEIRSEESADVLPYLFHKSMETIVIKLDGKLLQVINEYKLILDKFARILVEHKVVQSNFSSLHKGRLFYLTKEYKEKNEHNRSTDEYKKITKVFAICTTLYHAYDLLLRHGLRSFLKFFEENIDKPLLFDCVTEIREMMNSIAEYVGPALVCEKLPDGTHLKLPENCKFGHPKFYKLSQILLDHFNSHDISSKVMIFCEYKESVIEAYAMCQQHQEIKPKMFMGQSSISQKQQVHIIDSFRSGGFNTLISTCIGEEGIDVGFVDLVICFDIANKSSVRLIQRIGRTGRDRNGRVIILVSEGREQQVLKECLQEKQHLCDTLVHAKNIDNQLYKDNPRMVPDFIQPQCQELFIATKTPIINDIRKLLRQNISTDFTDTDTDTTLTKMIPHAKFLCFNSNNEGTNMETLRSKGKKTKKRTLHSQSHDSVIGTSQDSDIFISLMKQIEYKRYNIPFPSETKQITTKEKSKQADIRNMFKLAHSQNSCKNVNETGFNRIIETKISSLLTNLADECQLCKCFEPSSGIKRDLVPITDTVFDLSSITAININSLLQKYKYVENNNLEIENLHVEEQIVKESPLPKENELENSSTSCTEKRIDKENVYNISDDLFDDCDFSEFVIDFENKDDDNRSELNKSLDINEQSSLCVGSKQKIDSLSSDNSDAGHSRQKKSKKRFSVEDLFDFSVAGHSRPRNAKKRMNNVEDIFDLSTLKTSTTLQVESEKNAEQAAISIKRREQETNLNVSPDIFDNESFQQLSHKNMESPSIKQSEIQQMNLNRLGEEIFEESFHQLPELPETTPKKDFKNGWSLCDVVDNSLLSHLTTNSTTIETVPLLQESYQPKCVRSRSKKFSIVDDVFDSTLLRASVTAKLVEEAPYSNNNSNINTLKSPIMNKFSTSVVSARRKARKLKTNSDVCTFVPEIIPTTSAPVDSDSPDSPVINTCTKKRKRFNNLDATEAFDKTSKKVTSQTSKELVKTTKSVDVDVKDAKKCLQTRSVREFIDLEAVVSSDEIQSADEPLDHDVFDASFVDDAAIVNANNTQMHAVYLQSVKSPVQPYRRTIRPVKRIDSFMDEPLDQTYVQDSFCVDSDSLDFDSQSQSQESMSELEKAELKLALANSLKVNRKTKQRKNAETKMTLHKKGKWQRIAIDDSDSDSD